MIILSALVSANCLATLLDITKTAYGAIFDATRFPMALQDKQKLRKVINELTN